MVVRMRSTRSHTGNRRAHHALKAPALASEKGVVRLRHRASSMTGTYRGVVVIDVEKKLAKKAKKEKESSSAR